MTIQTSRPFLRQNNLNVAPGELTMQACEPADPSGGRRLTVRITDATVRKHLGAVRGCSAFVLGHETSTPSGGLAVLVGDVAFYLLVSLADPVTTAMLFEASAGTGFDIDVNGNSVPVARRNLLSELVSLVPKHELIHDARIWFPMSVNTAPALPHLCADAVPAIRRAKKHRVILATPARLLHGVVQG